MTTVQNIHTSRLADESIDSPISQEEIDELEGRIAQEQASTALVPYFEEEPVGQVVGFVQPVTDSLDRRLNMLDKLGEYTGVPTVKFADLEGKHFEGKNPAFKARVLGVVVTQLGLESGQYDAMGRFFSKKDGQERHPFITLIKIEQGHDTAILLFNSFAATKWARMMMQAFGCIADWPRPETFIITEVPAKVGKTYTFRRVTA